MEEAKKIPYVTLNSGYKMPQVGLGTGRGKKDLENAQEMIKHAIVNCGYRLIDTAKIYDTEGIIAEVL
jgi:diketogulonate reductase-like aldo/keto reductase